MLIGFDARPLQPGLRHWGIGMVVENVIRGLSNCFDFVGFAPRFDQSSEEVFRMWPNLPGLNRAIFEVSPWLDTRMDVYWGPAHVIPAAARQPCVLTTHDLVLLMFPNEQRWGRLWRARFLASLRKANKIVTDSATTARDLVRLFPQLAAKTEVALLGYDCPDNSSDESSCASCEEPFVIMLGAHRRRKNLPLAIAAVDQLRSRGLRLSLLVSGNIDSCFEHEVHRYSEFVKPTGVISKGHVFALLRKAAALLFPSVYEGFGFPMLEGMAGECPVLALDTDINREIGGSAAQFLPAKPEVWADSILELSRSLELRQEMVERGKLNLRRFSWHHTAKVYKEVFEQVVK